MRTISALLCCIPLTCSLNAQENCINGIDDDGDAQIDLNDSLDCSCQVITYGDVSYLFPNRSFEEFICQPTSYSQLDCADGWSQATFATSDYFLSPTYMPSWIPQPLPGGGNGCVGGYFCPDYMEYIGTCLPSPMVAGTDYSVTMSVSSFKVDNSLANTTVMDLSPVDLTIYGFPSCPPLPIATSLCPGTAGWTELGHASYTPDNSWSAVTINFTPVFDVEAIMFGAPCVLPSDYPLVFDQWLAYFLIDDLSATAAGQPSLQITAEGSLCLAGVTLTPQVPDTATSLQWYRDGVAIPGATDTTLLIADEIQGPGTYQFMAFSPGGCVGGSFNLPVPEYPAPNILEIGNALWCDVTGIWQWYLNGQAIPGANNQGLVPWTNGEYSVEVILLTGCNGMSAPVSVQDVGMLDSAGNPEPIRVVVSEDRLIVTGAEVGSIMLLFDASGRLLTRSSVATDPWSYELGPLPSGVYLARVGSSTAPFIR